MTIERLGPAEAWVVIGVSTGADGFVLATRRTGESVGDAVARPVTATAIAISAASTPATLSRERLENLPGVRSGTDMQKGYASKSA